MYYVYIGYRDLPRYFNDQNQMGGTPRKGHKFCTECGGEFK